MHQDNVSIWLLVILYVNGRVGTRVGFVPSACGVYGMQTQTADANSRRRRQMLTADMHDNLSETQFSKPQT